MKSLIALVLLITCEVVAQPITLQRGRLWGDSLAWQTTQQMTFDYAEDANLLFIPKAMRYILVYDLSTGIRSDTIDLVEVFGRDDVVIQEISCSRSGGVVAVAWNNTNEDSGDVVVFSYPSLELIREHVLGDSQPAFKQTNWGLYPVTVSPKGTYLACPRIDTVGVFLYELTSSNNPIRIWASRQLPVCFDTSEYIVATFSFSSNPLNRDTAHVNIIELSDPDSIVRVIRVWAVGEDRFTASVGISADGTEVFYCGSGSRLVGSNVSPACGTWDAATGVKTRAVNTELYNWKANRISTDGRWLVVDALGGQDSTNVYLFDRNDSKPSYQIPVYAQLVSEDLRNFYRFGIIPEDTVAIYCDTIMGGLTTSVVHTSVRGLHEWSAYPNPTNGNITIQNLGSSIVASGLLRWQIVDMRGIAICTGDIRFDGAYGEVPIPMDVANGQYIISLKKGAAVVMSKMFVVSR